MAEVAAARVLLETIKQLLLDHVKLVLGAKDELEGLEKDLGVYKAFLKASKEKRSINEDVLQAVMSSIRQEVYKAEDVIEKFLVEMTIFDARGFFMKAWHGTGYSFEVRKLAEATRRIRDEAADIKQKNEDVFKALLQDTGYPERQAPAAEVDNVVPFGEEDENIIQPLNQVEKWNLLERKVFGQQGCHSNDLHDLGGQIASKCEGAVALIARILLNNHRSIDWWKKVADNVHLFIDRDQRGFMETIAFRYNHLPYHLIPCFLYLGVFPQDREIPTWKLIWLWIAEGFIEDTEKQTLEDVAEAYVKDLVHKKLLTAVKMRSNGGIKTCRIHKMLYGFCKTDAKNQNFYQEIRRGPAQATFQNYRRVCVSSGVGEYMSSNPSSEHVRSFLCFEEDETSLQREHISKAFKLLRVLDILTITFDIFPKDIFHLVLLRYVAISCKVSTLPPGLSRLRNVQILILNTNSDTLKLRKGIWKMHQLRHLRTNASLWLPSPPSGKRKVLENMQSLTTLSPKSCTGDVFARTPYIKKLGVRGNLRLLFANLSEMGKLEHLTNLKLLNEVSTRPPSEVKIMGLPPAFNFLTMLKKLTISNTFLEWKHMHIIGTLEELEVLKLKENAFRGSSWKPKDGGFSSLQLLHIGKTDLVTWEALGHHFPSLKHLVLHHCENLERVPPGLADVDKFQVLALYHTQRAADSAREIQQRKMTTGEFTLSIYPP